MRTNEDIAQIVQGAFRPLRCVPEIRDGGQKLKFRVYDPDGKPIPPDQTLILRLVRNDQNLETVVENSRDLVKSRGFKLDPWALPKK